jgi:hypothetical protein
LFLCLVIAIELYVEGLEVSENFVTNVNSWSRLPSQSNDVLAGLEKVLIKFLARTSLLEQSECGISFCIPQKMLQDLSEIKVYSDLLYH